MSPNCQPGIDTLATLLRERGYHVAIKGKWHVSKPVGSDGWGAQDPARIERDYGFSDWEPPDTGGTTKAEDFGGASAGESGQGWDEDYTRQMESWLARPDLPEPFCLVFSLVNPHDVLGYPSSYREGGYGADAVGDLGVSLPPTIDEDLREKPAVQALSKLGMDNYLGPLSSREDELDYVNFYAHLHAVVDEKIRRLLAALGPAEDPDSLRSRTVIVRTSDHGEMGLSHGGLRQKIFNAYEETIRVPLVVSSPEMFDGPRESDALVSLVDIVPTMLGLAGEDEIPVHLDGCDLGGLLRGEGDSVRDAVLFTYDDHQAATALQNGAGQPNRIRCVRDARWKYAVYLDPAGRARPEFEMYDLAGDPDEAHNLLDRASGLALQESMRPSAGGFRCGSPSSAPTWARSPRRCRPEAGPQLSAGAVRGSLRCEAGWGRRRACMPPRAPGGPPRSRVSRAACVWGERAGHARRGRWTVRAPARSRATRSCRRLPRGCAAAARSAGGRWAASARRRGCRPSPGCIACTTMPLPRRRSAHSSVSTTWARLLRA